MLYIYKYYAYMRIVIYIQKKRFRKHSWKMLSRAIPYISLILYISFLKDIYSISINSFYSISIYNFFCDIYRIFYIYHKKRYI